MYRKKVTPIAAVAIVLGLLAFVFRADIKSGVEGLLGNDYPGPGSVEVSLVISSGDDGAAIAKDMVAIGIVKDFNFTYKAMIARNQTFLPGTFRMLKEMKTHGRL